MKDNNNMENKTERPVYEILAELRNHPDIVRLEWVTKQSIEEEFEFKCEMKDIHSELDNDSWKKEIENMFNMFWEKKQQEIKQDSHRIFTYNEYYTSEIIDEYLAE